MFGLGEKAFYPAHGVGVVEKIESKNLSGTKEDFYTVKIVESGMMVMVPHSRAKEVGLRKIVSKQKAKEVFNVLKVTDDEKVKHFRVSQPWTRRYRDYMAKLKTGSIFDHADILKELSMLQGRKQLSFGEKKLLEQVRKLLYTELSCCHGCTEDHMNEKITALLS